LNKTGYRAGELVYVPSGVVLEKKETSFLSDTPAGIKILEKPMDLLVTNVFDNRLEIYYEGILWSVSKKDVFRGAQ
tara:strand:- start:256 stop:483 length:228 start_codon:yes stop_codon:yes gene_type:complete